MLMMCKCNKYKMKMIIKTRIVSTTLAALSCARKSI